MLSLSVASHLPLYKCRIYCCVVTATPAVYYAIHLVRRLIGELQLCDTQIRLISVSNTFLSETSHYIRRSRFLCEGSMQKSEYSTEIITDSVCLTCRAANVSAPLPLCMSTSADVHVSPFLGPCVRERKRERIKKKVSQQEKCVSVHACGYLCVNVNLWRDQLFS